MAVRDPIDAEQTPLWRHRTWGLLCGLLVLRIVVVCTSPLELCADEAYYWDWSRQLDWGYYSKPPLIAWIIALATSLSGPTEWSLRIPAAILGTLGLWAVSRLGEKLYDARTGFWSALAVAATPGVTALSMLMTIDAPFLCAWAFTLWFAWEVLSVDDPDWKWVGGAVISTGLGLLAKQTMFAIFPLTVFWLCLRPETRRRLASPKVWTWWLGSLAFLTPVVWWNARHGWITLQHTSEHFQQRAVPWWQHIVWCAEFWAGQLGVVSPVTAVLAVSAMVCGLSDWRRLDRRVQYLMCLSAVPLAGVVLLSGTQRVQPNWPAGFMLPAIVLVVAWGQGHLPQFPRQLAVRRWMPIGVGVGALLALGTLSIPYVVPQSALAGSKFDPTTRLRGWRTLGEALGRMTSVDSNAEPPLVIAHTGRGPVSLLAFYTPGQPRVYRWTESARVVSQHEVWGAPSGNIRGRDAVILTPACMELPPALAESFDAVIPLGELKSHLGGTRWERLQVWQGICLRDWPQPQPETLRLATSAGAAGADSASGRIR